MSEGILGKGSQPVKGSSEAEEKLRAEPSELVAAVTREMSEPTDGLAPTPVALVLFLLPADRMGRILPLEQLRRI